MGVCGVCVWCVCVCGVCVGVVYVSQLQTEAGGYPQGMSLHVTGLTAVTATHTHC